MKKALLLPSRHDEKIAAAMSLATDASASVYEKRIARLEWRRLVLRQTLEKRCIAIRAVGRYGLLVIVATIMLFFRPSLSALLEWRIAELWAPLLICGVGGIVVAVANQAAEVFREVIAKRFPSSDDL